MKIISQVEREYNSIKREITKLNADISKGLDCGVSLSIIHALELERERRAGKLDIIAWIIG